MNRTLRGLLLAAAFGALAAGGLSLRKAPPPPPKAEAPAAIPTYDHAVAELARKKKTAETLADAEPGSWSRRAAAASVQMGYAQLTGDYDSYVAADESLAQAFRTARGAIDDDAVGPLLLKAQLGYELHRLRPALASLEVPEKQATYFHDQALLSEITSLRGAIMFQLGDYDAGIALLRRSIELGPTPGHKQRLAIALANVGGDEEATSIFDETTRSTDAPRSLAWIELQRGKMALARGRREEGRKRLENARMLFPGFWQTEEHLAELDAEEGHTARAIASYRALVRKTGDPEFMDALADLVDPEEARALRLHSNAIYEDRLAKLPEASYGHALEHFLKGAADPARGLEIAKKNFALRPNGEARTRLAQAYVRAGRLDDARREILAVVASKWVSAESYATAAVVLRLAKDPRATAMEDRARERNPHALDAIAWLAPV
jgi:tetratricopeptide (TPR) repeat protein